MSKQAWEYYPEHLPPDGMPDMRQVGPRSFLFVEIIDVEEHGCSFEKGKRFVASLALVDLAEISEERAGEALSCCGLDLENYDPKIHDRVLAEACFSYGAKAPLGDFFASTEKKATKAGYTEANRLATGKGLAKRLDEPVNAIGSTAREFMTGDRFAGLARSVEAGQPEARLIAKMYGIPQEIIDDSRPEDFLPYMCGYLDSMGGRDERQPGTNLTREGEEISPEYGRGHERASRVRAGECPAPAWLSSVTPSV